MKNLLLSVSVAILCGGYALADTVTVSTLFNGEQNVTWDKTLSLPADNFEETNVGDYIFITFSSTTDVIELKSSGQQLPGSLYTVLGEDTENLRCYITDAGLQALKTGGLELCGANFTVTGVSICNDGFVMPEGAVWGGFFWVSNWNTMEVWKQAFNNYNGEKYMIINISEDNGDNINYIINVRTSWEDNGVVALNESIEKTPQRAIVNLENVEFASLLAATDRVMIQGNPEGGNPFNFTSVVLANSLPSEDVGAVDSIMDSNNAVDVYNLQGVLMKKNVDPDNALTNLPKGIYLLKGNNGSKKMVK